MIVDPDFLTHWKTKMLVDELQDPAAPLCVIALWAHCQQRKTDVFEGLTPNTLKAICRFGGDGQALMDALTTCRFIECAGRAITVHGWAETNAKLVANWKNGPLGGRPKGTHKKPTENPPVTDREEKIDKKDKIDNTPPKAPQGGQGGEGGNSSKPRRHTTPTSAEANALAEIYNRRKTTSWSDKEIRAFRAMQPIDAEELALVQAYYAAEKSNQDNILRRDLLTLLNNFPGEVDRARAYLSRHRPRISAGKQDPWEGIDQDRWEAFVTDQFPILHADQSPDIAFGNWEIRADYIDQFKKWKYPI